MKCTSSSMDAKNLRAGVNGKVVGRMDMALETRYQRIMNQFLGKHGIHGVSVTDGVVEVHSDEEIPDRAMEQIRDFARPYMVSVIKQREANFKWPTL